MKITFLNNPNLSGNSADEKHDARIKEIEPHLEEFIKNNKYLKYEEVSIEFAHTGVASFVMFMQADKKYVLKIALSSYSAGENEFLKMWQEAGVRVPEIYETGKILSYEYILMEFIDAPILQNAYSEEELHSLGKYKEAGSILRTIHKPIAEGFGQYRDGKGEYDSFPEYFESEDYQKRVRMIKEQNLLEEKHGSLQKMKEVLYAFIEENPQPSCCHFDYSLGHIFATEPLTVFDPAPHINNRYIDTGRTIVNYLAHGKYPEQFVEGYFENEEKDEQMLHASIMFNVLYKLPYIHKKGKTEFVDNLLTYLVENRFKLER